MFFRNYPPHHTYLTRFRARHSGGIGGKGDFGETYKEWEAQEQKIWNRKPKKDKTAKKPTASKAKKKA